MLFWELAWAVCCFASGLRGLNGFMLIRRRSIPILVLLFSTQFACQDSPEKRAQKAMERGRGYLEKKDCPKAVLEHRLAAKYLPKSAETQFQLGQAFLACGQVPAAYLSLKRAADLDSNHVGAKRRIAEVLASSRNAKDLEEASKLASALLEKDASDESALNTLAIAKFRQGDKQAAEELLEGLLRNGKSQSSSVLNAAMMRLSKREIEPALDILRKGAAADPKSVDLALALAKVLAFRNDVSGAEAELKRASVLAPENPTVWVDLSTLYAQSSRQDLAIASLKKLGSLPDAKFSHLLPLYFWHLGRKQEALDEFKRLRANAPRDSQALLRLATAYRGLGQTDTADELLENEFKKNPKDHVVTLGHSQSLVRKGLYPEAIPILQRVIAEEKNNAEAHLLLAGIYRAQGQTDLEKQELYELLKSNPGRLDARLKLFQSQLASRQLESAADVLKSAPVAQQSSFGWKVAHVDLLLAKLDLDDASAAIAALGKESSRPEVQLQRGRLALLRKQFGLARNEFEALLSQPPYSLPVLGLWVQTFAGKSESETLLKGLANYAQKAPDSAGVQVLYANWLTNYGRLGEGKAILEATKSRQGTTSIVDVQLAQIEFRLGNYARSRDLLLSVCGKDPKATLARGLLGDSYAALGNLDEAIRHYRIAVGAAPDDPNILNNLASYLLERPGNTDEALQMAQKAKELDPNNVNLNDTLGWAFYQKGIYASALPLLEQSIEKGNAVNRFHLVMALAKMGRLERARKEYAEAMKIAPQLAEAKTAQRLLEDSRRP
jgi:tetratricopeptide (TPR) repeat protein